MGENRSDARPMPVTKFMELLPDKEAAGIFLENLRWGVFLADEQKWVTLLRCSECGSNRNHPWNTSRKKGYYKCNQCRKLFCVKAKSVLAGTHYPLHKWLWAWYFQLIHRKGIPSTTLPIPACHLAFDAKITQCYGQNLYKISRRY